MRVLLLLILAATACNTPQAQKPAVATPALKGDMAGARTLLATFLDPKADHLKLTLALQPTAADYAAVYTPELATVLDTSLSPIWDRKAMRVKPSKGQNQLLLWSATTEQLKTNTGDSKQFPGGYRRIIEHLRPGITLYRFKFVEAGKTLGMAYDGLTFVNGRWIIIPKPWRLVP